MTWYFDPVDRTLESVQYDDGNGNTYTVASGVLFSGGWDEVAPDEATDVAMSWVITEASNGNTQTALTALAELQAGQWREGTP